MPHAPIKPGDTIANKYLVERLIGEGGMGAVFAARHLQLEQLVAIKFLLTREPNDAATQRFRREARAAARIRSEHVCRVLDVGELQDGTPYMVMEYLEGSDLADELDRRKRLPVSEAVGLVLQACEAIAEAHVAGIVHRDIKPGNLFLARRPIGAPTLKVLDFGISKVLESGAGMALTSTLMQIGSPLYMSPEQIESSKDVDGRTDVWSLGVVLYELVTGRTPYVADTMPQLVHAMMSQEPPSFDTLGIEVPQGFERVVQHALQRDREQRIASVGQLASELAEFADEVAASTAVRIASIVHDATMENSSDAALSSAQTALADSSADVDDSAQTAKVSVATPSQWERSAARTNTSFHRKWPGVVAGVLAACAVLGATYWFTRSPQSAQRPALDPAPTQAAALDESNADLGSLPGVKPSESKAASADLQAQSASATTADAGVQDLPNAPRAVGTVEAPSAPPHTAAPRPHRRSPKAREVPSPSSPSTDLPTKTTASSPQVRETKPKSPTAPPVAQPSDQLPDFGGRR